MDGAKSHNEIKMSRKPNKIAMEWLELKDAKIGTKSM